jgi:hypothetical protein
VRPLFSRSSTRSPAISFEIAKDRRLVDLYLRGSHASAELDETERTQYSLMLLSFLGRAENVLFQTSSRMLYKEHWSCIRESIREIVAPPGARACWIGIRNRLNPSSGPSSTR